MPSNFPRVKGLEVVKDTRGRLRPGLKVDMTFSMENFSIHRHNSDKVFSAHQWSTVISYGLYKKQPEYMIVTLELGARKGQIILKHSQAQQVVGLMNQICVQLSKLLQGSGLVTVKAGKKAFSQSRPPPPPAPRQPPPPPPPSSQQPVSAPPPPPASDWRSEYVYVAESRILLDSTQTLPSSVHLALDKKGIHILTTGSRPTLLRILSWMDIDGWNGSTGDIFAVAVERDDEDLDEYKFSVKDPAEIHSAADNICDSLLEDDNDAEEDEDDDEQEETETKRADPPSRPPPPPHVNHHHHNDNLPKSGVFYLIDITQPRTANCSLNVSVDGVSFAYQKNKDGELLPWDKILQWYGRKEDGKSVLYLKAQGPLNSVTDNRFTEDEFTADNLKDVITKMNEISQYVMQHRKTLGGVNRKKMLDSGVNLLGAALRQAA